MMSAGSLGQELLSEVEEERLDEVGSIFDHHAKR